MQQAWENEDAEYSGTTSITSKMNLAYNNRVYLTCLNPNAASVSHLKDEINWKTLQSDIFILKVDISYPTSPTTSTN